ncbi:hypothetical protein MASR2M15_15370 [Anaerolineales bacterium]
MSLIQPSSLHRIEIGQGRVVGSLDQGWQLEVPAVDESAYHNAQICDYDPQQADFSLTAPVSLRLAAQFSKPLAEMRGTAGFGFWNHPGVRMGWGKKFQARILPQAIWFFFASPPSDMPLAMGVPGRGWKAASFNARSKRFLALAPLAPLGFLMMRQGTLYRRLWPIGQAALGVSEALVGLEDETAWHDYRIEWGAGQVDFYVDGQHLHRSPCEIKAPLGFIAWLDNQYAVVSPQGRFGAGHLAIGSEQSLSLRDLYLEIPR